MTKRDWIIQELQVSLRLYNINRQKEDLDNVLKFAKALHRLGKRHG